MYNLLLYLSLTFSLSLSRNFSLLMKSFFFSNDDVGEHSMTCCKALKVSAAATLTSPFDAAPKSTWHIVGKICLIVASNF